MITAAYARTMAAYNAEMNNRVYAAAARLPDDARKKDRGAFFRSIHGTLSHLVWADKAWMARFAPDAWTPPHASLAESGTAYPDFEEMAAIRKEDDKRIIEWAAHLSDDWLRHDLTWHSGAAARDITMPREILVMHLFNHQTHHRGQAHAMLTATGEATGATDLPMIVAQLLG